MTLFYLLDTREVRVDIRVQDNAGNHIFIGGHQPTVKKRNIGGNDEQATYEENDLNLALYHGKMKHVSEDFFAVEKYFRGIRCRHAQYPRCFFSLYPSHRSNEPEFL